MSVPWATDPARWRLRVKEGRQTWHYVSKEEAEREPQQPYDRYWIGTLTVGSETQDVHAPL